MATTKARPMPGMLNTVSTITEPVTRNANVGPRVVTTGMSEFFKICLTTTRRSGRPLAHADRDDQQERKNSDRGGVWPAGGDQAGHGLALILIGESEVEMDDVQDVQ